MLTIQRRFAPFTDEPESQDQVTRLIQSGLYGQTWTQEDLLNRDSPVTVLLGEAGIGKSTVMRQIREDKSAAKLPVWFMEVADLAAAQSLDEVLDYPEEMEVWLAGEEKGLFLLDALDEASLTDCNVRMALRRLRSGLGKARSRARIVITCRVSDWFATNSEQDLQDIFNAPGPSESAFELVQLLPLNDSEIRAFAEHFGCQDLEGFLEALRHGDAWSYAARPGDVEGLVEVWNQKRELGSLSDISETIIQLRLTEFSSPRQNQLKLSPERARQGVTRLAGYAALNGSLTFSIANTTHSNSRERVIPTQKVLSDWTPQERNQLLSLGIFDEATYGRARFHHRSIQDYLAAQWLMQLCTEGNLARQELRGLLVGRVDGREVIPQHLRQVYAWLLALAKNTPIGRELGQTLLDIEPEIALIEGDPRSLSNEYKGQVLEAFARRYEGRQSIIAFFDRSPLARFASPSLADTVERLLCEGGSAELMRTLILLAELGQMTALVPQITALALSEPLDEDVRARAVRTLGELADEPQLQNLRPLIDSSNLGYELIRAMALTLYPKVINTAELIGILSGLTTLSRRREGLIDGLAYALPKLVNTSELRLELLRSLLDLIAGPRENLQLRRPMDLNTPRLATLLNACATIAIAELEAQPEKQEWDSAILETIHMCAVRSRAEHFPGYGTVQKVADALEGSPSARRQYFWFRVDLIEKEDNRPTRRYGLMSNSPIQRFRPGDLEWLIEDTRQREDIRDRLLTFDLICSTTSLSREDQREEHLRIIEELAANEDALARRLERQRRPRSPYPQDAKFAREEQVFELRRNRELAESREALHERIDGIAAGTDLNALLFLYESRGTGILSRYEDPDLSKLAETYGEELTKAYSEGLKALWKQEDIGHARSIDSTSGLAVLCLTGVAISVSAGERLSELNESLQRRCVRIATWELNSFPDWLITLSETCPEVVVEELSPVIKADLEAATKKPKENSRGTIFLRLCDLPEIARKLCAKELWPHLTMLQLADIRALEACFALIEGVIPIDQRAELAQQRVRDSAESQDLQTAWWLFWFSSDPLAALNDIEERLSHLESSESFATASEYMIAICDRVRNWSYDQVGSKLPLDQVPVLRRFVKLTHQYVRYEDDLVHEGSHWVGPRDNAQEIRRLTLERLVHMDSPEARQVIRELAKDPVLEAVHEYLLRCLEERQSSSHGPLDIEEIEGLGTLAPGRPGNASSLFRLVLNRLSDLKSDYENGDFSFLSGLKKNSPESVFQNIVARELREQQRGLYSVVREQEVRDEKMPDISVLADGCESVAIEMKIAENWTFNELKDDALEEQLVGRYLRDRKSNHGILLLVSFGEEKKWRPGDGSGNLDFQTLVTRLQQRADELALADPTNLAGLRVVGIVMRPDKAS